MTTITLMTVIFQKTHSLNKRTGFEISCIQKKNTMILIFMFSELLFMDGFRTGC